MTEKIQTLSDLQDLLVYNARKLMYAESQLKYMLPGWINRTQSVKMKEVLMKYGRMISNQLGSLKTFFAEENILPLQSENTLILAYIREMEEKFKACPDPGVRDACLLASVQEINHYKVSNYGTAAAFANVLEMDKAGKIFHEAEVNEKRIDDRLSQLAIHELNARAKTHLVLPL